MSGCLLWLSGGAWLYLHYFRQIEGEFGPEVNPLEPWMMRLHGLVLIPALLALGGLLVAHIPKGWKDVAQRNIGLGLSAVLCLLIISGYLLVDRTWKPDLVHLEFSPRQEEAGPTLSNQAILPSRQIGALKFDPMTERT